MNPLNPNLKKKCFLVEWSWQGGGGARVSDFFSQKNPNLKKKSFFFGGEGGGVDGWTVKQAQTNLPLQLL